MEYDGGTVGDGGGMMEYDGGSVGDGEGMMEGRWG